MDENSPVSVLKGVGTRLQSKLEDLGIFSVADLLFRLPIRYQDRTKYTPINELNAGSEAFVKGIIEVSGIRYGRKRNLITVISDGSGRLTIRQFYFSRSQEKSFQRGALIQCYGEVRDGPSGLEMIHPEFRLSKEKQETCLEKNLTPVYSRVDGIGQLRWRSLINQAWNICTDRIINLPDFLSPNIECWSLVEALKVLHNPPPSALNSLISGIHPAQKRIIFEELLAYHLLFEDRRNSRSGLKAEPIISDSNLWLKMKMNLEFVLTQSQIRCIDEIMNDLKKSIPALRLLQGDVGCGKTVVAAAAVLAVIESGHQAVIMAPTELLAEQHYKVFSNWFNKLDIEVGWLSSSVKKSDRRLIYKSLHEGDIKVIIGTHALFQDGVEYNSLGLVVIDEQHRFGVSQRMALWKKGHADNKVPHQIIISATPIPRSLTMAMYGDMDISTIKELPIGRKPVDTVVIPNTRRLEVQQRIEEACASGRQAYWVCPLIEESDVIHAEAVKSRAQELKKGLPGINIGILHGRNSLEEKEQIMDSFRLGEINLLVATTVIEVGVDVPAASLMIIENAERLGLSQLHQLRGRVGRGGNRSACVLMYQPPLGNIARERLSTIRQSKDGFFIAQKDLELRGPGELMGTRQSGAPQFRVADLARDHSLLPLVQLTAKDIQKNHPELVKPLMSRWINTESYFSNA